MNKNVRKTITENNSKNKKISKTDKIRNNSIESKSGKNKYYKYLKFINKKIIPKKEEIIASKSKIISHIKKIFFNAAKYSNKEEDYFISKNQLLEILIEANVVFPKKISLNQTDIILAKLYPHKTKYNFIQFMNILTELCHFLYKDNFILSPKESMDDFLTCLYNNYKEILIKKNENNFMEKTDDNPCTLKCLETIISSKLERPIFKLILTLYNNLVKIYKVYFPNELINYKSIDEEKLKIESSKNLLNFWKDFELYPNIISKDNINMYYNLLMKYVKQKNYINKIIMNFGENKTNIDLGIYFKLSNFILCLYHFCIFYHYKKLKFQDIDDIQYDESLINVDDIIFFFKKLENSNGIKSYLLKSNRTNEYRFNFLFAKKDINTAKYEMNLWNDYTDNNNINPLKTFDYSNNNNNKIYELDKLTIESGAHTSRELTEENKEDEKNDYYLLTNGPLRNKKNSYNYNKYFLNINKKNNNLISISDLDEILNISQKVKEEIIIKLEKLSEIFLKYGKINNKLEYNRMSYSAFIQFLKDSDILIEIPKEKKIKYRKISNDIMNKTYTISGVKKFEKEFRSSISCNEVTLTKEEIDYKKNISKMVNLTEKNENKNKKKLNIVEASLIFSKVTGTYNFPSHIFIIKNQFNKKKDFFNKEINEHIKKQDYFEPKKEMHYQKDVPNKMNFALFIKSFELIAIKLYPDMFLDDAVSLFLDLKIEPFIYKKSRYNDKNEIKKALNKMENQNIKEILKKLGDIIYPFYIEFADNNKEMKFYQFYEFYMNLKLFPEMISLSQMKNIFYILCDCNINRNKFLEKNKIIPDKIDFNFFLKSLGISSMLFNFKNIISDIDRLLYIYYFILESRNFRSINTDKNILKKIENNLKNKGVNKYFRNNSIDDLNNRKLRLNYNNKTYEAKYVPISKKIYTFYDIYK